jgi:hypothetical protein
MFVGIRFFFNVWDGSSFQLIIPDEGGLAFCQEGGGSRKSWLCLPGFFFNMHEAKMSVQIQTWHWQHLRSSFIFSPPLWKRIKVERLAVTKFILISFCWHVSLSPWSTAKGSGLESWNGGYFHVNWTLRILPGNQIQTRSETLLHKWLFLGMKQRRLFTSHPDASFFRKGQATSLGRAEGLLPSTLM